VQNAFKNTIRSSVGSYTLQQLQHMIMDTIDTQYKGVPRSSLVHVKPFTKHIDGKRMSPNYQPPKFWQCKGKGNLK